MEFLFVCSLDISQVSAVNKVFITQAPYQQEGVDFIHVSKREHVHRAK